jgi:hypothetical protein
MEALVARLEARGLRAAIQEPTGPVPEGGRPSEGE